MAPSIMKHYVSGKVKSIKWQPRRNYESTDTFLTGTWDDQINYLSLWHMPDENEDPSLQQELSFSSNINIIQYITEEIVAVGLGDGSVILYQNTPSYKLDCKQKWSKCHKINNMGVPCTALATNGEHLASVGEDGNLVIHQPERIDPIRTIESGSGCSDLAVTFVKASEVLTANLHGHLRLWDIRAQKTNSHTLLSPDHVSIYHMASHPTQQHLVAAGNEVGALVLWDMRNSSQPFSLISAHSGPISEVHFHPAQNNHLFTSSLDGQVFHWDSSASSKASLMATSLNLRDYSRMDYDDGVKNAWLSAEVSKGVVDTINLIPSAVLPMNSISIQSNILLAGSDEAAVYIVQNVMI